MALACAARLSGYDPLCSTLGHNTPSVPPTRKFTRFSSTSHLRQYDRSGRSTGTAFITYSSLGEAMAAKKKLDGQLANGQEISIKFESTPTGPRGARSSGAHSLLDRVQKPPLAARLSDAVPRAPPPSGTGPIRTKPRHSAPTGPAKDRAPRERPPSKKPLTAEDLDKQLDMYTAESANNEVERGPAQVPEPSTVEPQDVEMT